MQFTIYVIYKDKRGEFEVDAPTMYDGKMIGAKMFLDEHPDQRLHDDERRPYPIPVRPSWLVNGGCVHARIKNDRRIKY